MLLNLCLSKKIGLSGGVGKWRILASTIDVPALLILINYYLCEINLVLKTKKFVTLRT